MIRRNAIIAIALQAMAFAAAAAKSPLMSAEDYVFTAPQLPSSIVGRVMGPKGDYRQMRSEDVAYLYEAFEERRKWAAECALSGSGRFDPTSTNLSWRMIPLNVPERDFNPSNYRHWVKGVVNGSTNIISAYALVTNVGKSAGVDTWRMEKLGTEQFRLPGMAYVLDPLPAAYAYVATNINTKYDLVQVLTNMYGNSLQHILDGKGFTLYSTVSNTASHIWPFPSFARMTNIFDTVNRCNNAIMQRFSYIDATNGTARVKESGTWAVASDDNQSLTAEDKPPDDYDDIFDGVEFTYSATKHALKIWRYYYKDHDENQPTLCSGCPLDVLTTRVATTISNPAKKIQTQFRMFMSTNGVSSPRLGAQATAIVNVGVQYSLKSSRDWYDEAGRGHSTNITERIKNASVFLPVPATPETDGTNTLSFTLSESIGDICKKALSAAGVQVLGESIEDPVVTSGKPPYTTPYRNYGAASTRTEDAYSSASIFALIVPVKFKTHIGD